MKIEKINVYSCSSTMASLLVRRCVGSFLRREKFSYNSYNHTVKLLTAQEVAAALRPFYFAVHPDLFWQYPKEKEVNENSLKQLNSFLETLLQNNNNYPVSLTFFLRNTRSKEQNGTNDDSFKTVQIKLVDRDLHKTVHTVLSACELPTEYLDNLSATKNNSISSNHYENNTHKEYKMDIHPNIKWKHADITFEEVVQKVKNEPDLDLRKWLNQNIAKAEQKLKASQPIREEANKLCADLKDSLQLKKLVWDCGWGVSHYRGCLLSFKGLSLQHPDDMKVLRGRTLVFGLQTGVSLDGHVILSSEDVRHNWLDLIQSVGQYDLCLKQVPAAEKALSEVLRGIVVDHRKFQPSVMVQKYVQHLQKLTASLYRYWWQNGYPEYWPSSLKELQLVVESEAGPLMLSPTGQFIVPASCPAFLLVDFIFKNMNEAQMKLQQYKTMRSLEWKLYTRCMAELGLASLNKDDNVTPDLMVNCCQRLLENSQSWNHYLRNSRLRVSHYYSILHDGEICIPWNWKCEV